MAVEFTDGLTTVAFGAMDEGEESDNVATVAFVVVRGSEAVDVATMGYVVMRGGETSDDVATVGLVEMRGGEEEAVEVVTVAFVAVRGGEEAETIFIPRKRNQHDIKMFAVTVANVKCSHCNIFTLTVVFHVVRKMLCYLSLLSHFLC